MDGAERSTVIEAYNKALSESMKHLSELKEREEEYTRAAQLAAYKRFWDAALKLAKKAMKVGK
jgi:hypothetical protein